MDLNTRPDDPLCDRIICPPELLISLFHIRSSEEARRSCVGPLCTPQQDEDPAEPEPLVAYSNCPRDRIRPKPEPSTRVASAVPGPNDGVHFRLKQAIPSHLRNISLIPLLFRAPMRLLFG